MVGPEGLVPSSSPSPSPYPHSHPGPSSSSTSPLSISSSVSSSSAATATPAPPHTHAQPHNLTHAPPNHHPPPLRPMTTTTTTTTTTTRSAKAKGKEPARGGGRHREWDDDDVIRSPPNTYPHNADRLRPPPHPPSATIPPASYPHPSLRSPSTNSNPSATPTSATGKAQWQPKRRVDSVGSLLADIANTLDDTLHMLRVADRRHWGADEEEQERRLEATLDEAARDFQELSPLVNGQYYYENDRNAFSTAELSAISDLFASHRTTFHEWLRTGGPINPLWANETASLKRTLHRAQCRAAGRIFASGREESHRCLGAHIVRSAGPESRRLRRNRQSLASVPERASLGSQPRVSLTGSLAGSVGSVTGSSSSGIPPGSQEEREQVAACNEVGKFERFGDRDIAFSCDFCDGFLVWEDLSSMPSTRLKRETGEMVGEHRRSRNRDSLLALRRGGLGGAGGGLGGNKGKRRSGGPRELILPRFAAEKELMEVQGGGRGSLTSLNGSEAGTRSSVVSDATGTTVGTTLLGDGEIQRTDYAWMASGISYESAEGEVTAALASPRSRARKRQSVALDPEAGLVDPDSPLPSSPLSPTAQASNVVEKTIIFAPVAIANHVPPPAGEWQARLLCPYCDEWVGYAQGDDEMEAVRYAQDESGFDTLEGLREHLGWYHVPGYLEGVQRGVGDVLGGAVKEVKGCVVM